MANVSYSVKYKWVEWSLDGCMREEYFNEVPIETEICDYLKQNFDPFIQHAIHIIVLMPFVLMFLAFITNIEDGLDIIDSKETERTAYSAPLFIPPAFQEILNALKEFGIHEKYAFCSPLLNASTGRINIKTMKLHNVLKDGNCGYRVLSYLLTGTQDFHWQIRLKVMAHIAENGDKIRGIWTTTAKLDFQKRFKQLAHKMPSRVGSNHYAGNNDFCGFASLVNINVFVNIQKTESWAPHIKDDEWNEADSALFIHYVNGNHFMAVVNI